ncbi:His-Xaa-Ser repeat protein HxsA3 [Clostridium estertheticum]|uniref:His-Xaa-Ser repeat protein HxsA3 n=1 Tax=Clostridium estertheticum TaxID=238834 RepID=UPI001C7D26D7|nr:His-Xaa-Ser repeat protein HxsA3 [Clostridium estertheticum]MBX4264480.1 His-Xaa-Ser repeat protein HxsA3 [Clostridium estertheticum]WLC89318.1 His-Xaa-Ser repeat protein HxsA3 [Clostridium estertheticum]
MDNDIIFPKISKSISDYLYEEEGNISREKVLFIGSLLIIVGIMIRPIKAFAGHGSHASHASHVSSAISPDPVVPVHSSAPVVPAHSSAPVVPAHSSAPVVEQIPQTPQVPSATPIAD